MDYDYDHLPKEQRQRSVQIEERLRGPSGKMPAIWEMKRRVEFLEKARSVVAKRSRYIKILTPFYVVIVFALLAMSKSGSIEVVPNWVALLVMAIVTLPYAIVVGAHLIPFIQIPATTDDLELELNVLDTYIERKSP